MQPTTEKIHLTDGRSAGLYRLADVSSSRTVFLCHPAPGSGGFDPDPDATSQRDVNLLAIDRPGYGLSDPMPGGSWATVGQAADDLAEVIRAVAEPPVGVAGWSAGGRVAMALAARHPELVDRLVVVATPAPNEHVQWVPDEIQQGLDALRDLPAADAHQAIASQLEPAVPASFDAEDSLALLGASDADAAALELPGARERLAGMLAGAFSQGITGLASDIAGYSLQPWGFDPADVAAKTLLIYGTKDPLAGSRHATWWQKALPDARVEMTPRVGHLLILHRWERALSHLAPGTKR